jgi:hypothetical protein
VSRAVELKHDPFGRTDLQNSLDNLTPPIIAESYENERRVASTAHVLTAQLEFKPWKHTLVMKRDDVLGDLKLLPERRRALELLNKADGLRAGCGQKTARHQGYAHDAKRACDSENFQHRAKGQFYDGTKQDKLVLSKVPTNASALKQHKPYA